MLQHITPQSTTSYININCMQEHNWSYYGIDNLINHAVIKTFYPALKLKYNYDDQYQRVWTVFLNVNNTSQAANTSIV